MVTIPLLADLKRQRRPIVMVTAYDHPSGSAAEAAGVDVVLVGDSGAMTVLGHPDTVSVTVEEMLVLARAARRAVRTPLFVVDLPFGSYEISDEQAVATGVRFLKEAGADAVKLEGGGRVPVSRARALVDAGVPVMGHVGLTPQTATALGGYRAQGRTAASACRVLDGALALQDAGCFALVFEAIPRQLTGAVMPRLAVPVIGIGAGTATDGQVLVFHDLLGIRAGGGPRFVRRYADLQQAMDAGVRRYAEDVRSGAFPAVEHTYDMPPDEWAGFLAALGEGPAGGAAS
ncbi:3-methyl-2-oxobutanoate hydroxymethyltransferase [Nakamurella deserti]|uniref:3-methyl-2-oxobutanoate hydroxymethyltransferase n=1 Tax=Nakamurella deserti TaxID=2164074 RepID=UPI000DBE4F65|nr:3-methyl-2-oxobutanoate hydroxymethyltransferase [Nakamurella deserti]